MNNTPHVVYITFHSNVFIYSPGEKQLESDKREMKNKISILNRAIDSVRRHRFDQRLYGCLVRLPRNHLSGQCVVCEQIYASAAEEETGRPCDCLSRLHEQRQIYATELYNVCGSVCCGYGIDTILYLYTEHSGNILSPFLLQLFATLDPTTRM